MDHGRRGRLEIRRIEAHMTRPKARDKRGTVPRAGHFRPSLWITPQPIYQGLFNKSSDFLESRGCTPRGTVPRVPRLSHKPASEPS